MSYATIYDMTTACPITDGVQSGAVCDAVIIMARQCAKDVGHSVIVEDRGTQEVYRVTPTGCVWKAPRHWGAPPWKQNDD